jgi:choline dehydrogenase-like flavoprotein
MFAESIAQIARGGRLFDVCLVGSGPAGITLASELDARGLSVLLLEAGGAQVDPVSQEMFEAEVVGPLRFDPAVTRLRCFGGSSNHWGGFCRPLDAIDFEDKIPGIDSAWPIARSDLDPFLGRAETILELPPAQPDTAFGEQVRHTPMRYSPPVHFAVKYRPLLQRSSRTLVALDACVVGLQERGGHIHALQVCGPDGVQHAVRARQVVLCAGGIENSRLLLWANACNGGRVVPEPYALGRYWFEHPHFTLGEAWLGDDSAFEFDRWSIAWAAPMQHVLRDQGMLNVGLRLTRQHRESARALAVRLGCVAPALGRAAMSQLGRRLTCGVLLRASWEQAPQPWNRVVLSADRDRLGVPRAELHWRLGDLERTSARNAALMLATECARRGVGRVRLDDWVLARGAFPADDEIKGNHHMGGTRMSRNARRGVVDANCRVHGCANLFVAGSSVFPSGGASNPTLTIVQLALRLADHLTRPSRAQAIA